MLNCDEFTKIIKEKVCSGCGKSFYWEPYDEIGHDGECDVRIVGQCWNDKCKKPDDMLEFMAVQWISREEYDNGQRKSGVVSEDS